MEGQSEKESLKHPGRKMLGSYDVLQLCSSLIRLIDAKNVLDIGTFTGNSALAWALTIPEDGKVITMDLTDQAYIKCGQKIIEKSGVLHKIEFNFQSALKTLNELIEQGFSSTFDFAFIDADKQNYSNYYECCMKLIRPKGIIAIDNSRGSINNPCPVVSVRRRFGGLNAGIGLRLVGEVYARGYSQNEQEGYKYWTGKGGTPGIGIIPNGISLGVPMDITAGQSQLDCNVKLAGFNPGMTAPGIHNSQVAVIGSSHRLSGQNMPMNLPIFMPIS